MPTPWVEMADQLATILGISRNAYLREALQRQMMEDWTTNPGRGLVLNHGARVFKETNGVFRQVAKGLGGERFFIEANIGRLPAPLGGVIAVRGHVVPIGLRSGLLLDNAIVDRSDLGPVQRV
jgi:hypothetical protein